MPKRLISKYLPHASTVTHHRSLRWLGNILHDSNLWHLNRRSVASAMFAGVFACFMPIPGQMLLAATLAIYFHCNLPLSIALTWISNPLTYVPIYYLCYRFGLLLMGVDHDPSSFEWTMEEISNNLMQIGKPLFVGCVVAGLICGALAYFGVRLFWRLHVQRAWLKRKAQRAKEKIGDSAKAIKQKAINQANKKDCAISKQDESPEHTNPQTEDKSE